MTGVLVLVVVEFWLVFLRFLAVFPGVWFVFVFVLLFFEVLFVVLLVLVPFVFGLMCPQLGWGFLLFSPLLVFGFL